MDFCNPEKRPYLVLKGLRALEPLDNVLVRAQVLSECSSLICIGHKSRLFGLPRLLVPTLGRVRYKFNTLPRLPGLSSLHMEFTRTETSR